MNFNEFIGHVQNRLELSGPGEAVRATRATLRTLGERLHEGEATDLASTLPMEIDRFLIEAESGQRFDYDEFLDRVSERSVVDRSEANCQAQQMMVVLADVVPEGKSRRPGPGCPKSSTRCSSCSMLNRVAISESGRTPHHRSPRPMHRRDRRRRPRAIQKTSWDGSLWHVYSLGGSDRYGASTARPESSAARNSCHWSSRPPSSMSISFATV